MEDLKNNESPKFQAELGTDNFTYLKAIQPVFMPNQNLDFVIDISTTEDCEKQNIAILKEANDFYLI